MPGWFPEWFIEIETDMNGDIQQLDKPLEGAAEIVDEMDTSQESLLHIPGWCFFTSIFIPHSTCTHVFLSCINSVLCCNK